LIEVVGMLVEEVEVVWGKFWKERWRARRGDFILAYPSSTKLLQMFA
jgi:hypothetical protein